MLNHTTHPQGRDSHNLNKHNVSHSLHIQGSESAKPAGDANTHGLLAKPLVGVTIMATVKRSQQPEYTQVDFIWRFIALSTAQPRVIHIEATSEQEARQQSPTGCVMVFAARIRQGVRHVQ